jgi:hypothetical protein
MTRTLESWQEAGFYADNGKVLRGFLPVEAAVTYERDHDRGGYKVRMVFISTVTGKTIATYETHYTTDTAILDDLGIDEIDEVWEILD